MVEKAASQQPMGGVEPVEQVPLLHYLAPAVPALTECHTTSQHQRRYDTATRCSRYATTQYTETVTYVLLRPTCKAALVQYFIS